MLDQLLFEEANCLALDEFTKEAQEKSRSKPWKPDVSPGKDAQNFSIASMPNQALRLSSVRQSVGLESLAETEGKLTAET